MSGFTMGGTEKSRRQKQEWFSAAFKQAKEEGRLLSKKKLLALFALNNFSTEWTGETILNSFRAAGMIEVIGDEIEVK